MKKTANFIAPELVAREPRALIIRPAQAAHWTDSIHTVREVLAHTEDVFDLMERLIADGDYSAHFGIPAVLALAKRAVAGVSAESEALLDVAAFLKPGKE